MNKILLAACALTGIFCAVMAALYLNFPAEEYERQLLTAQSELEQTRQELRQQEEQAREALTQVREAHVALEAQLKDAREDKDAKAAEADRLEQQTEELETLPEQIEALRVTYGEKIRTLEELVQGGQTDIRICYLTFDDGPNNLTAAILSKLEEHQVYATFFTIGANSAQKQEENLRAEMMGGHTVANHSYSHAIDWGLYSDMEEFAKQVMKQDEKVYQATGFHMNLFRFPSGSAKCPFRDEAKAWLAENGYKWIDWNASGWDSGFHSFEVGGEAIARNVKSTCKNLDIAVVLLHDFNYSTYAALDIFIPELKEQGFVFLPLFPQSHMLDEPLPVV